MFRDYGRSAWHKEGNDSAYSGHSKYGRLTHQRTSGRYLAMKDPHGVSTLPSYEVDMETFGPFAVV